MGRNAAKSTHMTSTSRDGSTSANNGKAVDGARWVGDSIGQKGLWSEQKQCGGIVEVSMKNGTDCKAGNADLSEQLNGECVDVREEFKV